MESIADDLYEVFEFGGLVECFGLELHACIFIFGRGACLRLRDEDVDLADRQIDCDLKEDDVIWVENGEVETEGIVSEGSGQVILGLLFELLLALISKLLG